MAKQDFIIKQQAALSSDPSAPPAGYLILYPKTDGQWYSIDSSGVITQITNTAINNNPLSDQIFS